MDFPFKEAKDKVDELIAGYQSVVDPSDNCPVDTAKGRMYELVVLSYLVEHLTTRGFRFQFHGKVLELKEKPGLIKGTDPYFEGQHHRTGATIRIYTDVQVLGLGCLMGGGSDFSSHHEVDLVVVTPGIIGRPSPHDLLLGVECKSGAFTKAIIKEVLGVKRELSLLQPETRSDLSCLAGDHVLVPAEPEVEFWLAHYDPKGANYKDGPEFFGIQMRHLIP